MPVALKKELKRCKESKSRIEKEYVECERELRNKTEEVEKLKVENKDLKQIISLKEDIELVEQNHASDIDNSDVNDANSWKTIIDSKKRKEDVQMNCCKCDFKSNNKLSLKKHMNDLHPEKQFNCDQCDFQATAQLQLNKHINLKHKEKRAKE